MQVRFLLWILPPPQEKSFLHFSPEQREMFDIWLTEFLSQQLKASWNTRVFMSSLVNPVDSYPKVSLGWVRGTCLSWLIETILSH